MPRHRTLKALFLDTVVFVGMFALLGHLSLNFWERFVIQTELTNMKTSLHSLKETIAKIGYAYDTLHQELVGLTITAKNKTPITPAAKHHPEIPPCKKKNSISRSLYDMRTQALAKVKNNTTCTTPMYHHKTVQNYMQDIKKNKTTQNILHETKKILDPVKNISTITRYPRRSTGVGVEYAKCRHECINEEYCKHKTCTNSHRYCKEYECYNPIDNWKF